LSTGATESDYALCDDVINCEPVSSQSAVIAVTADQPTVAVEDEEGTATAQAVGRITLVQCTTGNLSDAASINSGGTIIMNE